MSTLAALPMRRLRPYLWLAPALALVVAVSFWPLAYALVQSLHRSNYLDLGTWAGLDNYARFLLSEAGQARAWNSFVLVAGTLAIAMPLGFGLALLLDRDLPGRNLFRTILILPWLVSNTVAALLWAWLLNARFGRSARRAITTHSDSHFVWASSSGGNVASCLPRTGRLQRPAKAHRRQPPGAIC